MVGNSLLLELLKKCYAISSGLHDERNMLSFNLFSPLVNVTFFSGLFQNSFSVVIFKNFKNLVSWSGFLDVGTMRASGWEYKGFLG